jgi:hypothetical protein
MQDGSTLSYYTPKSTQKSYRNIVRSIPVRVTLYAINYYSLLLIDAYGCACIPIYAARHTAGSEMLPQEVRRGMLIAMRASGNAAVGFRFFKENSANYWVHVFFCAVHCR